MAAKRQAKGGKVVKGQSPNKKAGNTFESNNEKYPSSPRLKVLQNSLLKKEKEVESRLSNHFDTVARANGQPLNDKRNGRATLNLWDKQNDSIRNQYNEIEKTKQAIEMEQSKIIRSHSTKARMPKPIINALNSGEITQWRKHPEFFFVAGVDKARIHVKNGVLSNRYFPSIKDPEQQQKFKDVYMKIFNEMKS